jgi:GTP 3',8-cyclase
MPAEGVPKLCHNDVLSYEDMYRIACESVRLGIEKIRVTGGEPLVRTGVVAFIERLTGISGLKEIVLTTNGTLLEEMAVPLRQAGLHRLNISLDSMKPETFAMITRGGDLRRVMNGITAAETAGFQAAKINMVVMRGVNDDEVLDFAELTLHKPCKVRFIEYMPTRNNPDWKALCVSGSEVLERIGKRHVIAPMAGSERAGPARNFKIAGAVGTIGIITPMSDHFCESCNRLRITSSGVAKGCLFAKNGIDLKPYLACADAGLGNILREIVLGKPLRHLLNEEPSLAPNAMSQIGG